MPDPDSTSPSVVDYAHLYAGVGLRVLPIRPGAKTPSLTAWTDAATTDPELIGEWWGGLYKGHGIGIALGQLPDGRWAFAIDIDGASHGVDGAATWHDLCATYPGHRTPDTVEAITGGGGRHLIYAAPTEIRNGTLGPKGGGIDIRGKGGQILVEPTLHPDGPAYCWVEGHEPWNMEIADAPGWVLAMLAPVVEVPERAPTSPNVPQAGAMDRPGDLFAASTSWAQILEGDGWTLHHTDRNGEMHWTRPGKERRDGTSATTGFTENDNLKVFTSSVPALEVEGVYSKIGYWAATRHGGDHAAAASSLAGLGHHVDQAPVDLSWTPSELPPATPGALGGGEADLHGWEPVDLASILAGDYEAPRPTIGRRTDGQGLFYPGRVNAIQGESGSGKSWVCIWAAAQEMEGGNHVLYIDLEDHAGSMIARLRALGVGNDTIAEQFHYINPARSWNVAGAGQLAQLCDTHPVTLAVIDSTGEAMALDNAKPNDDDDTARWFRRVPRSIAAHGPAVVITDHLPKANDAPALFAIGSQRKRAAIDGVAYRCDVRVAPSKGGEGHLGLVCAKDRNGTYQQNAKIADVHVLSTDEVAGAVAITVESPLGDDGKPKKPTIYMEKVSRWLEDQGEPVSKKRIKEDVSGRAEMIATALDHLANEGFVRVITHAIRGVYDGYEVVTPYREGGPLTPLEAWTRGSYPQGGPGWSQGGPGETGPPSEEHPSPKVVPVVRGVQLIPPDRDHLGGESDDQEPPSNDPKVVPTFDATEIPANGAPDDILF